METWYRRFGFQNRGQYLDKLCDQQLLTQGSLYAVVWFLALHPRSQTASHFAVNLRALHTLPAHQKMRRTATAVARNESSSDLATRASLRDYIRECVWGGERVAPLSCRKGSSNMQTVTQLVCTSRTYWRNHKTTQCHDPQDHNYIFTAEYKLKGQGHSVTWKHTGVDVQLHSFLVSVLEVGEQRHAPAALPFAKSPGTQRLAGPPGTVCTPVGKRSVSPTGVPTPSCTARNK
jgi:hypothetical protein